MNLYILQCTTPVTLFVFEKKPYFIQPNWETIFRYTDSRPNDITPNDSKPNDIKPNDT